MGIQSRSKREMKQNVQAARPTKQDIIAKAIHDAVASMPSPAGRCLFYAHCGQMILKIFENIESFVQVGSLSLFVDPNDPSLMVKYNAANGNYRLSEFHAWLATRDGIVIDFSTRDFRSMVEGEIRSEHAVAKGPVSASFGDAVFVGERIKYRRPTLDYIWCRAQDIPRFVRYTADAMATMAVVGAFLNDPDAKPTSKERSTITGRQVPFLGMDDGCYPSPPPTVRRGF